MKLPNKRTRQRSGIERVARKRFPRHRRFVKSHVCCVCGGSPTDFAHVKTVGAGAGDWFGVPLCRACHSEQHTVGIVTFQQRHTIDLYALAVEFVWRSTDPTIRDAFTASLPAH